MNQRLVLSGQLQVRKVLSIEDNGHEPSGFTGCRDFALVFLAGDQGKSRLSKVDVYSNCQMSKAFGSLPILGIV